ncbi:MAG: T9SS type A sorting domain-containing protein, partial [Burkholderiales bacterium]|nr:T9SS type A sorting domain-containing protein [Bacteroidia bacterium]
CSNSITITQDVSLCTGIASLTATETMMNVYPNPNKGLFIIELTGTSQVSISNTLGQVIMFDKLDAGKHNLDIQNQSTGIYFVKVIQDGKQHTIKLIKE